MAQLVECVPNFSEGPNKEFGLAALGLAGVSCYQVSDGRLSLRPRPELRPVWTEPGRHAQRARRRYVVCPTMASGRAAGHGGRDSPALNSSTVGFVRQQLGPRTTLHISVCHNKKTGFCAQAVTEKRQRTQQREKLRCRRVCSEPECLWLEGLAISQSKSLLAGKQRVAAKALETAMFGAWSTSPSTSKTWQTTLQDEL
ncbi:hypothetical protein Q5P01_000966 [Channa striata]|uniref:Uncharacterized protein n=1 Tax=Channa striata TaxID=64152 RepID=A0AA88LMV4_CHASR|nr:hypothetical protein Q5P01_000966 [Channa striata]